MSRGVVFLHIAVESIRKNYLRLSGELGKDYRLGQDYSYVECIKASGRKKHVKAGETVFITPEVTIDPKKCKILVVPNSDLALKGSLSFQSILEEGEGDKLVFNLEAKEDFNLNELSWVCRLYTLD